MGKGIEIRMNPDGTIDEVCSREIHIEQLNAGLWMCIINSGKDHLHLEFRSKDVRRKIILYEFERKGCTRKLDGEKINHPKEEMQVNGRFKNNAPQATIRQHLRRK